MLLVLAAVVACDAPPDDAPPSCADWLACYDACEPWAGYSSSAEAAADRVLACDVECRELADRDDAPPATAGILVGPPQTAVVAAELEALDVEADADAGRQALAWALVQRGRCVAVGE